jgi:hypothetical protein
VKATLTTGQDVTVKTFCTAGQAEPVKGGFHAAAGVILGLMAVYNAVAWWHRRERHLGWNTVLYGAALGWEIRQTHRHLRRRPLEYAESDPRPRMIAGFGP